MRRNSLSAAVVAAAALGCADDAQAQRADESAVRSASDAFGTNIGSEQVGLYSGSDARGFSPSAAGNIRLEGFYVDSPGGFSPRLIVGSQVRVGLTAQSYPFPAPTGIVDYRLRPAGDRPVKSLLVSGGPFGGATLEFDAQQPLIPGVLRLAYGLYYSQYENLPGDTRASYGVAVQPRWTPTPGLEVRGFYGVTQRVDDKGSIQIFPAAAALPPKIRAKDFTPPWLGNDVLYQQAGVMTTAALGGRWTLRAGGFWYENDSPGLISDSYLGVDAQGLAASRRFTNLKPFSYTSISGETRLTGVFTGADLRHTLDLTLRGRKVQRTYGGAAVASVPNLRIGEINAPPPPTWTYGPDYDDTIRQYALGAAYQVAYRRLGEVGLGLQRVDYQKTLVAPGGVRSVVQTRPWLLNGAAALNASARLALYGAFTRGLEEAPVAPEVAANAAEPPPAIRTRQQEFGARVLLPRSLRLVVGYFDIRKPYFNLDGARIWRELGVERHSGLETSLTGQPLRGLTLVGGYVRQEPRVSGEAVRSGLIADKPVGQPRNTVRASLDYRLPQAPSLSVDATLVYYGARPISSRSFAQLGGRQLMIKGSTTLDVGMRQRFKIDGHPATFRALLQNVADTDGWTASTAGGLSPITPRRLFASVTADF